MPPGWWRCGCIRCPTRLFAAAAALRRDLVPVLAIRRATRGKGAGQVLLILMATAAIGTFAATILVSIDRSAEVVAWHDVGAPYRLATGSAGLPAALDTAHLPGVEAAASASQGTITLGSAQPSVLLAIDMQPYAAVVAGTPAVPDIPPQLLLPGSDPLPAIVSSGSRPTPGAGRRGGHADRGRADVPRDHRA